MLAGAVAIRKRRTSAVGDALPAGLDPQRRNVIRRHAIPCPSHRRRLCHAFITGKKSAGLYDHTARRRLRIAAEARAEHLQGYVGDRHMWFGGTLPELRDNGEGASLHMEIEGDAVRGYDRSSAGHFSAKIAERLVQLYDHAENAWFGFDAQIA